MAIEVAGKILLEVFGGYTGHYFKENHCTLVPSEPLISRAAVDVQKRSLDWSKSSSPHSNFFIASHDTSVIFLPTSHSGQQTVHVKTSAVN
jgi:hypothetical protein